jgi:hypothetical protein
MGFVTLYAYASGRNVGDTYIIPKGIKTGFLSEERRDEFWNRGKVAEINNKTLYVSETCWESGIYSPDSSSGFLGKAAGNVDGAAFGVENLDESSRPTPALPPLTMKTFPSREEMFFSVKIGLGGNSCAIVPPVIALSVIGTRQKDDGRTAVCRSFYDL